MVLLRWLSSCFLISKRNIQGHQKDTLDLAIHSSCLKALNDRGCLRFNQVLDREFKVKSPPPPSPTYSLARAWGECVAFIGKWALNIKIISHDKLKAHMTSAPDSSRARLTDNTTLLQHSPPAPTPFRDWHKGMFSKIRLYRYISVKIICNYFTLYNVSSLNLKIIWSKRVSFFVFLPCRTKSFAFIEIDGWKLIALFDIQIMSSDIQIMSKRK